MIHNFSVTDFFSLNFSLLIILRISRKQLKGKVVQLLNIDFALYFLICADLLILSTWCSLMQFLQEESSVILSYTHTHKTKWHFIAKQYMQLIYGVLPKLLFIKSGWKFTFNKILDATLSKLKYEKVILFMPLNINERALKINIGKQYLETGIHKKIFLRKKYQNDLR